MRPSLHTPTAQNQQQKVKNEAKTEILPIDLICSGTSVDTKFVPPEPGIYFMRGGEAQVPLNQKIPACELARLMQYSHMRCLRAYLPSGTDCLARYLRCRCHAASARGVPESHFLSHHGLPSH
jgi:hypothetical protein